VSREGIGEQAVRAAEAAADKKAEGIAVLDVSRQLVITDYFVICSGNNERQVRTIAEAVEERLRGDFGIKPFRREGGREARWLLLDYVDFVVHVFHREDREYYDLERLWSDAPIVSLTGRTNSEGSDEPAAAAT
jgi:ribosome-associated protein